MRPQVKVLCVVLVAGLVVALALSTLFVLVLPVQADAGHDVNFCFAPGGVFDSLVIIDHQVADNFTAIGWGWYPFPDGTCVATPPPPVVPPAAETSPIKVSSPVEEPPGRPNRAEMYIAGCFNKEVTIILIQPETGSEVGRFTTGEESCTTGFSVTTSPLLVGTQDAAWVMAFVLLPNGTRTRLSFASEVPCQIHETATMCGVILTTPGAISRLGILP